MRFFATLHDLKKVELSVLGALTLSFFIGIWHAFPMLNVVADEMYFVGGVLRAMENLTIFPAPGDVPYGTLTYVLNYALVALFVLGALVLFRLLAAIPVPGVSRSTEPKSAVPVKDPVTHTFPLSVAMPKP